MYFIICCKVGHGLHHGLPHFLSTPPPNALSHSFKLGIFKSVFQSVTILFCFFFVIFAHIGDQLVPFANRKITVWLTFEERKDRLLFVHKFMSTRKLALVIQNTLN